jgi:beta-lactamase class A
MAVVTLPASSQLNKLRSSIQSILDTVRADVGIAVVDLEANDTLSFNGHKHFPMQSVYKLHLGLAALHKVDKRELSLEQKVKVSKDDYFKSWSVLTKTYPDANVEVTLRELIQWTVMNSDNVACDILFHIVGGPSVVQEYVKSIGINDIAIFANERKMHEDWSVQFTNWTTPNAAATLLKMIDGGRLLKPESSSFLWKLMTDTPNAPRRLKGLLPEGTVVARKPGTGAYNENGVLGAANDVGIVVLPNGRKVIVAVFVTNTKEDFKKVEKTIASISREVYDHFMNPEEK